MTTELPEGFQSGQIRRTPSDTGESGISIVRTRCLQLVEPLPTMKRSRRPSEQTIAVVRAFDGGSGGLAVRV